jgi:hypothetical protein
VPSLKSLSLVAPLALFASVAEAGDNDFELNASKNGQGLLFTQSGGRYEPLDTQWRSLVTQLGYVFSPRLATPAETLGHSGFHVGAIWSGTFVSGDEPYWQVTERGQREQANSFLQTLQLDVRKGLPFSFEVGANLMWLVESELFAPGLEVRWAIHEGFAYAPDFGVRGSVNHMVGNRDMLLTTAGVDAVVSKSFGLLGMVNIAPYASWSFLFIAASSRVIDPTPTIEVNNGGRGLDADLVNNFVFSEVSATSKLHHKLTLGVRTLYYVLNISVQGEFQMADGGVFGSVATISTKLGLDF